MEKLAIKILTSCALLCMALPRGYGQEWPDSRLRELLTQIDSNNTSLQAMRLSTEAQKMENRTGLNPADPTVSVNYLRPNPRLSDHRLDFEISQELEFPGVYAGRRRVAEQQNALLDLGQLVHRNELLSSAVESWLEWIFYQKSAKVHRLQWEHAERLARAYQKAFDAGNINILERNRARVHAASAKKALEFTEIEIQAAFDKLTRLNGGNRPQSLPREYQGWTLPASLDQWLKQRAVTPVFLQSREGELALSAEQLKLARANRLPKLQVGFMREQDIEVDFRGLTLGLSLPLWQQKNQLRLAGLQQRAQKQLLADAQSQFELEQAGLFRKAKALETQINELRALLDDTNVPARLQRALELGEITLVDFLVEQGMYYDLMEQMLQAELDYQRTQLQLRRWDL